MGIEKMSISRTFRLRERPIAADSGELTWFKSIQHQGATCYVIFKRQRNHEYWQNDFEILVTKVLTGHSMVFLRVKKIEIKIKKLNPVS